MDHQSTDDRTRAAVFRAETTAELRYMRGQVEHLWKHNARRREEIEAIRSKINSAILTAALILCGLLFKLIGPSLGF